jgi:hypothetical protein
MGDSFVSQGLVRGGALMHESAVQYPKAMASDDAQQYIYVASMHSESSSSSSNNALNNHPTVPDDQDDWALNLIKYHKYGTTHSLLLERFKRIGNGGVSDVTLTFEADWRKPYALLPSGGDTSPTLQVAEILLD